ncbi:recombinase family protein [Oscillatoria amoena NRMC-F 0135]|nr:recombinase family protein [Oscillatoria amoena NRMC-F 0135]
MLSFVKKSKQKIGCIIVYSVDRFSRSGANAIFISEQLKQQGIAIHSVTQPTDVSTASGKLQQNIQFIFSEYDNQLRREKCMSGVKEALQRGQWCHKPPLGYDILKTGGVRKLVINQKGKLLKNAFLWKANEQLPTEEIRQRLEKMGLKIRHQSLSEILRNPFYCGYISHNALEGQLVQGTQEKLITEAIFLKANQVLQRNNHGYKIQHENQNVPLKGFLRCGHCGGNMAGYIVKKKNLWYYKCRVIGCANNKSAKEIHSTFTSMLEYLSLPKADLNLQEALKIEIGAAYYKANQQSVEDSQSITTKIVELQKLLERLEERFILEEVTKEMFYKYKEKYETDIRVLEKQLGETQNGVSNLDKCIETAINISSNLQELWDIKDYYGKQKLQQLVFPDGISYDKKNNRCRTKRVNWVFFLIASINEAYNKKISGTFSNFLEDAALVVPAGIEPATQGFSVLELLK